MAEQINVELQIEVIDNSRDDQISLSENWNFDIEKYKFSKLSGNRARVQFSFIAELISIEDGVRIHESPSGHLDEFQPVEDKLERLLDIIAVQTQQGIRIIPRSYKFSCSSSTSETPSNTRTVNISDISGIRKRFLDLKERSMKDPLVKSIRAYRSFLNDSELGWKITKLWSVLEQLYSRSKGSILDLVPRKDTIALTKMIMSLPNLTKKQQESICKKIAEIKPTGIIETVGRNLKIMNQDGSISAEEMCNLLKPWGKTRSTQAHGTIVPKRGTEEIDLFEMENLIQTVLSEELNPKLLHYLVFQKDCLDEKVYKHYGKLVNKEHKNYCFLPISEYSYKHWKGELKNYVLDKNSVILLVGHDLVEQLLNEEWKTFEITDLKEHKALVSELQHKINHK